jgi:TolB-like protein
LVSLDELMRRVWPGIVVSPETVSQRIKLLRDALGDEPREPRYIAGLRGRGYQLIAAVKELGTEPAASAPAVELPVPLSKARRNWLMLTAMLAVGAALAYLVADRFWLLLHTGRPGGDTALRVTAEPAAAAFNPPPYSIAVLPFVNLSGDKEQEYFSDGLTEELLNSLAEINELQVAARTSSFYFKGEHVDLATVARKLNVGAVLEGSVRRSANTVRVTAQLNNAVTGFHLWSKTYDRDLGDVLKLQTEIATAVASALCKRRSMGSLRHITRQRREWAGFAAGPSARLGSKKNVTKGCHSARHVVTACQCRAAVPAARHCDWQCKIN